MEYHEAADFLFGLGRFGMKPGTESTADVLAHLDDPHDSLECVQIAGSNGKGSTARLLERTLREAGYSVGLYTSPHLEDVRERIRVDGRKIPRRDLATFVEEIREYVTDRAVNGSSPTFFETMTALALWHFEREGVDVAVLEVGIGGKLDATSAVDPVASAVTSVSLEHTGVLGDTVEEIARDKAHVTPAGKPLVTALSGSALEAAEVVAGDVLTVGTGEGADVRVSYEGRTNHTEASVSITGPDWHVETQLPMIGRHQAENAGIAAALARQVGTVSETDVARGMRNAHWPGRFEVMRQDPLVVLDGAHNPDACGRLADTLSTFEYDELVLVFGAMHDKDHAAMIADAPRPDTAIACEPSTDRSENMAVLAEQFARHGVTDVRTESTVTDALTRALELADDTDCVLVTGSLFTVAEARSRFTRVAVPKTVRTLSDARETLAGAHAPPEVVSRRQGDALHHVRKTRLRHRQATDLDRTFSRIGGDCVVSGLEREGELIDVVLLGTHTQFERLVHELESAGAPHGLSDVARELRGVLEAERDRRHDRPIETAAHSSTSRDDASSGSNAVTYPWNRRTAVMGICNVTPDSFHDGGEYDTVEDAVARAEAMIEAGVDILDVGGESTRPGADPVPLADELERVLPVVERLADVDALVSVDTRKAAVAEAALEAGADVINDVSGLEDPDMRFVAAEYDAPLIVMHSIDTPVVPGRDVTYDDVVEDVIDQLSERILLAEKAGLDREQIIVDPGLGFGKRARESFELLGRLAEFHALGCPVLVGHSHKSMFEHVGCGPDDRLEATVAATALATDRGADIVRVHDVPENVAAVKTAIAAGDPQSFLDGEW